MENDLLRKLSEILTRSSFFSGPIPGPLDKFALLKIFKNIPPSSDQLKKFTPIKRWWSFVNSSRSIIYSIPLLKNIELPLVFQEAISDKKSDKASFVEKPVITKPIVDVEVSPVFYDNIYEPRNVQNIGAYGHTTNQPNNEKYYITTAINYTNGYGHIGHVYEAIVSDVFSRFHRSLGKSVYFQTGSDEHGQKIANAAETQKSTPIDICDKYVNSFKCLNERVNISNDYYVRTSDKQRHYETCRGLWRQCANDIYLGEYEGYYLVREERYLTEMEAAEWNYTDPVSNSPLKKVKESSYFFKMSKYQDRLIQHLKENKQFISPESYYNQILHRLENDELRDLSISRTNFKWGVPVPGEENEHVMYVWFDALTNYISGAIKGDDPTDFKSDAHLSKYWPCDAHVIGKDIVWFHCVIWPTMLMSANIELPKQVIVHGFVQDAAGEKMSKSIGNVIDPHEILNNKVTADSLRWYISKECVFGKDMKFSLDSLKLTHNSDLVDAFGNLVHRAINLGVKVSGDIQNIEEFPINVTSSSEKLIEFFSEYRLNEAAYFVQHLCSVVNKWITDAAPWKIKNDEGKKNGIILILLKSVWVLAHYYAPFIPNGADAVFKKLNKPHCSNILNLSMEIEQIQSFNINVDLKSKLLYNSL